MARGDGGYEGGGAEGGNRTVLQNGVRVLSEILATLQSIQDSLDALAPTTLGVSTVAALPSAATAGQGARRLVTDANATTFATVVAAGGANIVPIFSDGTNWRIG